MDDEVNGKSAQPDTTQLDAVLDAVRTAFLEGKLGGAAIIGITPDMNMIPYYINPPPMPLLVGIMDIARWVIIETALAPNKQPKTRLALPPHLVGH